MKIITESKELSRGVFWIINDELVAFPFIEDTNLSLAKSGNTYNHKKLWPDIKPKGCNKPYNYNPRGRVDVDNKGRAIIYLNPNIDSSFISDIQMEFGIRSEPVIRYDNSNHYKCHLDIGWKPEN